MTTLDEINEKISSLHPELQHGDRNKCAKMAGLTKSRAGEYINGKGKQADTAIKVLKAMKRVINKRKKALAS